MNPMAKRRGGGGCMCISDGQPHPSHCYPSAVKIYTFLTIQGGAVGSTLDRHHLLYGFVVWGFDPR
jgi:hypothetical protein